MWHVSCWTVELWCSPSHKTTVLDPLTNRTRCESSLAHSSAPLLVVCPPLINGNEAMLLLSLFVILIVSAMSSSADNNGGTNLSSAANNNGQVAGGGSTSASSSSSFEPPSSLSSVTNQTTTSRAPVAANPQAQAGHVDHVQLAAALLLNSSMPANPFVQQPFGSTFLPPQMDPHLGLFPQQQQQLPNWMPGMGFIRCYVFDCFCKCLWWMWFSVRIRIDSKNVH